MMATFGPLPCELLVEIINYIDDPRTYLNFVRASRYHWLAARIIMPSIIDRFLIHLGEIPGTNNVLPCGQKHGLWYTHDRKKHRIADYRFGKKQGFYLKYTENVSLILRIYQNNKVEGYSAIYVQIEDQFIIIALLHKNRGVKNGPQFHFARNYKPSQVLPVGPYFDVPNLSSVKALKGAFTEHLFTLLKILSQRDFEKVMLKSIESYKDKKKHGQCAKFEDGRIQRVDNYTYGRLHGQSRIYDAHGHETNTAQYNYGRVVAPVAPNLFKKG